MSGFALLAMRYGLVLRMDRGRKIIKKDLPVNAG
jgi:hypothetical protein